MVVGEPIKTFQGYTLRLSKFLQKCKSYIIIHCKLHYMAIDTINTIPLLL